MSCLNERFHLLLQRKVLCSAEGPWHWRGCSGAVSESEQRTLGHLFENGAGISGKPHTDHSEDELNLFFFLDRLTPEIGWYVLVQTFLCFCLIPQTFLFL